MAKSPTQRPPLLPTTRNRRILLWLLAWSLVVVVVLPTTLYLYESWQGRRAWAAYQAEAKTAGERLDLEAVIPPPVSDEENLAMAPLFMRLFAENGQYRRAESKDPAHHEFLESLKLAREEEGPEKPAHWRKGERTDLQTWAEHLARNPEVDQTKSSTPPARKVLAALNRFEPVMRQLEDAAARPLTRFPLHYQDGVYMHFQVRPMLDLAKIAQLRASARLAVGDTEGAYRDVQLMLRLGDAIGEVPTLIMSAVEISVTEMAMLPLWEGLATHRWSDDQLRGFQDGFAVRNHAAKFQKALRAERNISGFTLIDILRQKPEEIKSVVNENGENGQLLAAILKVAPDGWFDLNKAELGRFVGEILSFAESSPPRFYPERYQAFRDYLKGHGNAFHHPRRIIADLVARTLVEIFPRTAAAQGTLDLAVTAFTLERHWLRHGEYPDTLEKLDGDLLSSRGIPGDCVTGGAPHYSRKPDGTYTLYYQGWNQQDDGGTVVYRDGASSGVEFNRGDWVWPQPVAP